MEISVKVMSLQLCIPGIWARTEELHRDEVRPLRGQGGPRGHGAQVQAGQDPQDARKDHLWPRGPTLGQSGALVGEGGGALIETNTILYNQDWLVML